MARWKTKDESYRLIAFNDAGYRIGETTTDKPVKDDIISWGHLLARRNFYTLGWVKVYSISTGLEKATYKA